MLGSFLKGFIGIIFVVLVLAIFTQIHGFGAIFAILAAFGIGVGILVSAGKKK